MSLASTFFQFLASNAVTEVTGSVDRHRIIYLAVEMRNRSKDGGRYAQDHYRDGDRCDCDGHYGMGSVATGKHNKSAGRRQPRADARASPVVTGRGDGAGPARDVGHLSLRPFDGVRWKTPNMILCACKRCGREMHTVAEIAPIHGSPGLLAFFCGHCGATDSVLVCQNRPMQQQQQVQREE